MGPAPCPLCAHSGSAAFPIFYEFRGDRFEARTCSACGFVYLTPRPTDAQLAQLYSDEYFLHDGADCGAHSATDYETAARAYPEQKVLSVISTIREYDLRSKGVNNSSATEGDLLKELVWKILH